MESTDDWGKKGGNVARRRIRGWDRQEARKGSGQSREAGRDVVSENVVAHENPDISSATVPYYYILLFEVRLT